MNKFAQSIINRKLFFLLCLISVIGPYPLPFMTMITRYSTDKFFFLIRVSKIENSDSTSNFGKYTANSSKNFMLLAHKDELKTFSLRQLNSAAKDVSNQVHFYLCTRDFNGKQELFPDSLAALLESSYSHKRPTKIVIHGYLNNSDKMLLQLVKKRFLDNENVNLILVDWGDIARGVDYFGIAKKTVDVGAYTAKLIDFLIEQGTLLHHIHLIGHSLGAHICGFAGAAVTKGKVARITGLDPAKPGFNVPPEKRLDSGDAQFVDCIHSCSGILGISEPICTADFYPNGGINIQPGCHFYDFGKCSHLRSLEYFAESINSTHKFPALSCPSVPEKDHSNCKHSSFQMGYYTSVNARGIFYTSTNKQSPFSPLFSHLNIVNFMSPESKILSLVINKKFIFFML